MITKNLTFVVTNTHVENFVNSLNKVNTNYGDWAEEVKAFTISEKADPEVTNLALQLTFGSRYRLEVFEQLVLHKILEDLQNELPEQLLYFETHLEKLF